MRDPDGAGLSAAARSMAQVERARGRRILRRRDSDLAQQHCPASVDRLASGTDRAV